MNTFINVFQPPFEEVFTHDYYLKSKWGEKVFENQHPIILELGCGKGEYSMGLAKKYTGENFIGIDIKGARMWKGAKEANQYKMRNVAFLRTRIEFINSFFDTDEISEIWITFPDPQIKKRRNKKRLTSPRFLNSYKKFLKPGAVVHLKTDSTEMYEYTKKIAEYNNLTIIYQSNDLYKSDIINIVPNIQTFYEQMFLKEGKKINYIQFSLDKQDFITEPPDYEG